MACTALLGSAHLAGSRSLTKSSNNRSWKAGLQVTRKRVTIKAVSESEGSNVAKATAVAGLIANPVVLVSEFYLKTTGEGLPPGPGGIYGATEGVSYLVVVGIVAWSLYKKAKTGSGLPGTLLGAAEGLSYLSILGGVLAAGFVIAEKGSLPGLTGR